MLRRLAIGLLVTLSQSEAQLWVFGINLLALVLTQAFEPYRDKFEQRLEVFSLTMIVFNSTVLSDSVQLSRTWNTVLLIVPLAVIASAVLFAVGRQTILSIFQRIKA